jgi:hypothetical protein
VRFSLETEPTETLKTVVHPERFDFVLLNKRFAAMNFPIAVVVASTGQVRS